MRISSVVASARGDRRSPSGVEPTRSLDGTPSPPAQPAPAARRMSPVDAFRSATRGAQDRREDSAPSRRCNTPPSTATRCAQWKLGRMYAEGDGVAARRLRAFEYFRRIADSHADDSPARRRRASSPTPSSRSAIIISTAFRTPTVKRRARSARAQMFAYAASYFGDPEAQYQLGRAVSRRQRRADAIRKQAARWLRARRQQGPAQGAGAARPHAVQGRARAAPGARRPDVADARQRRRRAPSEAWIAEAARHARSSRRPRTSARWRSTLSRALGRRPARVARCRQRRYFSALRYPDRSTPARGRTASPRPARACRCRRVTSRSAACGDSSRWSMRMPLFFCQAPA